jgi:hypothetical protein
MVKEYNSSKLNPKNIDAAEYKHIVLGLIFLKYISDAFEGLYQRLQKGVGDYAGADPEDRDEYKAENQMPLRDYIKDCKKEKGITPVLTPKTGTNIKPRMYFLFLKFPAGHIFRREPDSQRSVKTLTMRWTQSRKRIPCSRGFCLRFMQEATLTRQVLAV